MTDMILIYVTCQDEFEAEKIGMQLLKKRLCACINIYSGMKSVYFWPPKTGRLEEAKETVLLVKTLKNKFAAVEKEVKKLHSDTCPCIFAIPGSDVSRDYLAWLKGEIK